MLVQEAVGQDASSMEELMERVQRSVADGTVDSVTISVGTQVGTVLYQGVLEVSCLGGAFADPPCQCVIK